MVKFPPCVNLNGTDKDDLFTQYYELMRRTNDLIEDCCRAVPHGRDYQIGPVEYKDARKEYLHEVVVKLTETKDYLEALAMNIHNQGGELKRK